MKKPTSTFTVIFLVKSETWKTNTCMSVCSQYLWKSSWKFTECLHYGRYNIFLLRCLIHLRGNIWEANHLLSFLDITDNKCWCDVL